MLAFLTKLFLFIIYTNSLLSIENTHFLFTLFKVLLPRWRFPKEHQTNCCCWLLHIHIMPCIFSHAPWSTEHFRDCYLSEQRFACMVYGVSQHYPGWSKTNINWWYWILCSVPAVSPHHASVWQPHHPSHPKSPLTGPVAQSSWLSFIIPADWLV